MPNKLAKLLPLSVIVPGLLLASGLQGCGAEPAHDAAPAEVPRFEVDHSWQWPPELPNDWVVGVVTWVDVDRHDHVWVLHRPRQVPEGLEERAAPPVLGWTAVSNSLDPHALLLFLIIFAWTPPHFWALAIARRKDYEDADIPMLPVTHGLDFTRLHILLYTLLLFIVSLLPFLTGMSGIAYLFGALTLGAGFIYFTVKLLRTAEEATAMRTFSYSIWYLMGLFAVLLVDHYIPAIARLAL